MCVPDLKCYLFEPVGTFDILRTCQRKENGCCGSLFLVDPILSPSASILYLEWISGVLAFWSRMEDEHTSISGRMGYPFILFSLCHWEENKSQDDQKGESKTNTGSWIFTKCLLYICDQHLQISSPLFCRVFYEYSRCPHFCCLYSHFLFKKTTKIYWHFL